MKIVIELKESECKALGLPAEENVYEFVIGMRPQSATTVKTDKSGKEVTVNRNDPGISPGEGWPVADTTGAIRLGGIYIKPGTGKAGGRANIL